MAQRVQVPLFDANITEGVLGVWRHKVGQTVQEGEPLIDFITDKANFEIESPEGGVLLAIVAPEKSTVPAGYCIAVIGEPGEAVPDVSEENRRVLQEHLSRTASVMPWPRQVGVAAPSQAAERVRATPRARKLARELSVDLAAVPPSAPGARLTEEDVRSYVQSRDKEGMQPMTTQDRKGEGAKAELVALVTGGARGIGRAVGLALAREGFTVAVNYAHSAEAATALVDEIARTGGKAFAVRADVSDPEAVKTMFVEVAGHGKLAVLVNNAGIAQDNFTPFMKESEWDSVIDVDLKGAFLCTREAAKVMMRTRQGRIVNVSSVAGLSGDVKRANYAAAKAGLVGLTKATARDLATFGVTVNAVAPGYIETDFIAGTDERARQRMLERIPLRRFGTPEEVAALVAFLCGDAAGFITGSVLVIDGGLSM